MRIGVRVVFAAAIAACAAGCGGGYVFRNPELPPAVLKDSPALLLPVEARGLPGNAQALAAAAAKGALSAVPGSAIDVSPALPSFEAAGLEGTGWEAVSGMFHLLDEHGLFDPAADSAPCGRGLESLHSRLDKLASIAARKFDLRFGPRWLLALGVQGRGKGALEGTLKYRVSAGIYDIQKRRIHTFVFMEDAMADDEKALLRSVEVSARELAAQAIGAAETPAE